MPKNGTLLLLAGVWDTWIRKGEEINTFSIITTPPNQEMQGIHNRMPLILENKSAAKYWLSQLKLDDVKNMLHQPKDGILDMYQVSSALNSVKNNGINLHERVPEQGSLF